MNPPDGACNSQGRIIIPPSFRHNLFTFIMVPRGRNLRRHPLVTQSLRSTRGGRPHDLATTGRSGLATSMTDPFARHELLVLDQYVVKMMRSAVSHIGGTTGIGCMAPLIA
ncbi:hypothetical protein ACOSQ2_019477 [Xanthoceras sorbifolium]